MPSVVPGHPYSQPVQNVFTPSDKPVRDAMRCTTRNEAEQNQKYFAGVLTGQLEQVAGRLLVIIWHNDAQQTQHPGEPQEQEGNDTGKIP